MSTSKDGCPQPYPQRPTPAVPDDSPPVPIAVWRLDNDPEIAEHFGARLARRLIDIYTRPGETIMDFDHDTDLQRAAITTRRSYVPVTHPADVATFAAASPPVSLVSLRWPRPSDSLAAPDLFAACQTVLARDACIIALMHPDTTGRTPFVEHEQTLRTATQLAGLKHVLQIVAINAPGEGDQFSYYSARDATPIARPGERTLHIDVLVFSPETT